MKAKKWREKKIEEKQKQYYLQQSGMSSKSSANSMIHHWPGGGIYIQEKLAKDQKQ